MDLVSLTPEGRILSTLEHGKHTYSELKFETGLSDRWLTIKLEELQRQAVLQKDGKWYGPREESVLSAYELSLYMISQGRRMADELAKLHFVRAIILFGSVARKNADRYSDLDMIILVSKRVDRVKKRVLSEISELEAKYHITIEPLILTRKDFLDNVHSREGGIIYGIAEGYEVLADKTGEFTKTLHNVINEIKRAHDYLEEERIWLKAK